MVKQVAPSKTKEYYVEASRRSRQRRKDQISQLTRRNCFLKGERPVLAGRFNTFDKLLRLKIAQNEAGCSIKTRKFFLATNKALKEEVSMYRHLSDQLKSFLLKFEKISQFSMMSLLIRKNVNFLAESLIAEAFYSARQPLAVISADRWKQIMSYYDFMLREARNQQTSYEMNLDFSNMKLELRCSDQGDSSLGYWCRFDVYDVPVPKENFVEALKLIRPDWSKIALNVVKKKGSGDLDLISVYPGAVESPGKDNEEVGGFKTQVATIVSRSGEITNLQATYKETLEPDFFASSADYPQDCEIVVSGLLPSATTDMVEMNETDAGVSHSLIIRQGSSSYTSHASIFLKAHGNGELVESSPQKYNAIELFDDRKMISTLKESDIFRQIFGSLCTELFVAKLMIFLQYTTGQYHKAQM